MTSPCIPHQFLLKTFLHSNLHSHFIHFLLSARSLNSHDYYYQVVFAKRGPSLVVSLVSSSLVHSCMPELSTFPLRLRDLRLSPVTRSTFLQTFVLAVTTTYTVVRARQALGRLTGMPMSLWLCLWVGMQPLTKSK